MIPELMDYLFTVGVALVVFIGILFLSRAKKRCPAKLLPGSLGLPVIGQTLGLFRAMRTNSVHRFFQDRVDRYGVVSKLSLFGKPTVLLAGPAANKFVFFNRSLALRHSASILRILGEESVVAVQGDDHRRIRGALLKFLTPDMLKMYLGRIDNQVRNHLEENWAGRTTVTVLPLMKRLTFDIISDLVLGSVTGAVREALDHDLLRVVEGTIAIPVNLPFTPYRRSLKASRRARRLLNGIMGEKMAANLEPDKDLISRLLSMTDDHGEQLMSNEEIVDNTLVTLIAAHDTTAALMTFMVRQLADDPVTLAAMVQEHQEIAANKARGEALVWEDLSKMTFTWRVAEETLRLVPPVFGNSRRALEDIEFDGYCIPKGWQVFWVADVTHMDPSIFHEPAKFNPSRFENHSSKMPSCSFVPFGSGPRMCPGIDFVKIETLVTMHHLVTQFRWKLCGKDNTFVRDPFPTPLNGLPIKLQHQTSP